MNWKTGWKKIIPKHNSEFKKEKNYAPGFVQIGLYFQNKIISMVSVYNNGSSQITGSAGKSVILETNYENN